MRRGVPGSRRWQRTPPGRSSGPEMSSGPEVIQARYLRRIGDPVPDAGEPGVVIAPRVFRFGEFQLDLESGELFKRGLRRRLARQPFQVLRLLVSRPGRVVSREELRSDLWPDDTFVNFEHSIGSAVNKLRVVMGDAAERPRFIETVPGRGYRFIAPLEAATVPAAATSLAVLPVANLSGRADLDVFCDAMTEALITALGQEPGLRVVSRQSVLRYRGVALPLAAIAHELAVSSIVESGLAWSGPHLRFTTRLLRATPETLLWAAPHELEPEGDVAAQQQLARDIAREIRTRLA